MLEGTVLLGMIGSVIGLAAGALWFAVDAIVGSSTLSEDRLVACLILGAVLVPVGVHVIAFIEEH